MAEKELFINAVQMVEVDGSWNIPTALLYKPDGRVVVGDAALAEGSDLKLINEDFKIDLGRYAPGIQSKRRFTTAAGGQKSAVQLADDFLYEVQKIAKQWLLSRGITECKNIVIAEPLSMHTEEVSPEWLANYRTTLRRILEGKTVFSPAGVSIRFIPEPFAAFQYYRHGIRHPLVAQRAQMNALVVDFGGGTCDVCIIETTKEGDISGGGRNKRPLAGKSLPIGGFALNRAIAESLIRRTAGGLEAQVKTGLREYREWIDGKRTLETLGEPYRIFIENFHDLVHRVEVLKLSLSRAVSNWSLSSDQRFTATIAIPQTLFEQGSNNTTLTMSIPDLREIFYKQIYLPHLKPFFTERFKAGNAVLGGAPITVVLLSGGSANLGWLRELLRFDFGQYLSGAPFVQIPDYQQVVAQGLAVDCAREFATGESDFKGVTYNPLFLLLEADEAGCEPRPFTARTANLPDVRQRPGLLLPTASFVSSMLDQPMQWRVKLNRAARHRLNYFFLQSSMDPSDVKNLQNVEETVLHTPPNTEFDSALQIQLTIRPDGTAHPRFIYKAGNASSPEISKDGRKFFIDMTDAAGGGGEAYLGLDFGTSNTAISYIDRTWVRLIETRSQDVGWKELGELVELLPSSLSVPLARYIGDVGDASPVPPGYSFIEMGLCLAAYISYIEFCCTERRAVTRIFKEFPHRSAGYLWHMLKTVQYQLGSKATASKPFQRLCDPKNIHVFDQITRQWAEVRHEVSFAAKGELLDAVRLLANVSNAVFSEYSFGFFQNVQKERFSQRYTGRFRFAHGKPPYSSFVPYAGTQSFSDSEPILVNTQSGDGISLMPLMFWYPCQGHRDLENGHCFLFDKMKGDGADGGIRYKAASYPCSLETTHAQSEMVDLVEQLRRFKSEDPKLDRLHGLVLSAKAEARG